MSEKYSMFIAFEYLFNIRFSIENVTLHSNIGPFKESSAIACLMPSIKAAIKREQSDACIESAEREQARPKVK